MQDIEKDSLERLPKCEFVVKKKRNAGS